MRSPMEQNLLQHHYNHQEQQPEEVLAIKRAIIDRAVETVQRKLPERIAYVSELLRCKAAAGSRGKGSGNAAPAAEGSGRKKSRPQSPAPASAYDRLLGEQAALKSEIECLIEMASDLKLWIQLHVPRIEDGNNFGVSVQEEVVAELTKTEDAGLIALDAMAKFLVHRAKMSTKVIKYPALTDDYSAIIATMDSNQMSNLLLSWTDLRANYLIIYDLIGKNLERLVEPRSATSHAGMY